MKAECPHLVRLLRGGWVVEVLTPPARSTELNKGLGSRA